jgi:hypothetical protein
MKCMPDKTKESVTSAPKLVPNASMLSLTPYIEAGLESYSYLTALMSSLRAEAGAVLTPFGLPSQRTHLARFSKLYSLA